MNLIETLLSEIKSINTKYEMIAQKNGSNFNIFNVLSIRSDEVKHSKFITELLCNKGLHNQGRLFFDLFIDCLNNHNEILLSRNELDNFKKINYKVIVEEDIGETNDENATGGRLDIVIKGDDNGVIVIENKVFAKDQFKQLVRYKNHYPHSLLLYLTPDGKTPDEKSKSADGLVKNHHYFCVSYKGLITKWIEICIQKVIDKPFIRENLLQYLHIIKSITNQAETMEQSNEVQNTILKSMENYLSAEKIAGEFENAKGSLLASFWIEVKEEIEKKYPNKKVDFTKEDFVKEAISAIFIKEDGKKIIGIEPLNGSHTQKRFSSLYIGNFIPNKKGKKH